jgi:hypothetical protein
MSSHRVWLVLTAKYVLDFTLALDKRRIRIHLQDLLGQRTIGPLLGRRGHDDGEVEELAERGVRHEVVAVERRVPVAGDLVKADLQVKDEENLGRVRCWSVVCRCGGLGLTELFLSMRSQGTAAGR